MAEQGSLEPFIQRIAKKYGVSSEIAKGIVLPQLGEEFIIRGIKYKCIYQKANPYSFTAVPVDTAKAYTQEDREPSCQKKMNVQSIMKTLWKKLTNLLKKQ